MRRITPSLAHRSSPSQRSHKNTSAEAAAHLPRRNRAIYILLVAYGITMLILAFSFRKIGLYDIETDFYGDYAVQARRILRGEFPIEPFHGPGYPLMLVFFNFIFQELFATGKFLSVLSSVLCLYVSYLLIRKYLGELPGTLAVVMIMLNPTFFRYSYIASSDMLFAFLVSLSLFISLSSSDEKYILRHFLFGMLGGILYLVRYNGVFFVLSYPLFLLYRLRKISSPLLINIALFISGFALIVLPWGLYTQKKMGIFLYNENHFNIAWEVYGRGRMSWDEFWHDRKSEFRSFKDVITRDPLLFVEKIGSNVLTNVWEDVTKLVGWLFIPLIILGIWQIVKQRRARELGEIAIFYGIFYLIIALVFYSERFSMPLLIFYSILSCYAFQSKNKTYLWAAYVLFFVSNTPNLTKSIRKFREDILSEPRDVLHIAREFVRQYGHGEEGKAVMARKPQISYYLGMEFRNIPLHADLTNLPEEMKKQNVRYLYFSGIEYNLRPKLQALANYQSPPPYLKPLIVNYHPFAVLYQLQEESPYGPYTPLTRPDTAQAPAPQSP